MATVINLPKDTRFEGLGRGLGAGFAAFLRKREKDKKAERFEDALDTLMTKPRGLDEEEDIAEEEPTPGQVEKGLERLPRAETDLPSIAEIVSAFGEFMEPGDLADIILAPKLAQLKRTPPLTPTQVREKAKQTRGGTLDAENEQVTALTTAMEAARSKGNNRRANTIEKQIEKLTGKSIKTIESEAKAKKSGEMTARREGIETIIESLNRGDSSPTATPENVFSGSDVASKDATNALELFTLARAFTMSGESSLSNNLINLANSLIDNSPEIALQRELNKPISAALAAELQVPVGTTQLD